MSYLKMALAVLQATTSVGEAGAERCGFTRQAPNHSPTSEAPQASAPERILSCSECPWYQLNPWTHQKELGAWCWWQVDGIIADNPACISYRRGEVPERRERRKEHE